MAHFKNWWCNVFLVELIPQKKELIVKKVEALRKANTTLTLPTSPPSIHPSLPPSILVTVILHDIHCFLYYSSSISPCILVKSTSLKRFHSYIHYICHSASLRAVRVPSLPTICQIIQFSCRGTHLIRSEKVWLEVTSKFRSKPKKKVPLNFLNEEVTWPTVVLASCSEIGMYCSL